MTNKEIPNQMYRNLLGIASPNPWIDHNSASRLQMFTAHLGQKLVVEGMTERYCQTGMEQEFGKYTFAVEIPTDCQIIAIIPKYSPGIGAGSIQHNPLTIVVFEDERTKQIDYVALPLYKSYHSHFGFPYKEQEAMRDVRVGNYLRAGTKLLDSPGVTPDGNYKYGVELNVAFMSHPAVSEDGILMSESALKKFKFRTYETRVVEWGKRKFPLNLYGDENTYKPFPDIGEYIRDDSLLMVLRNYEPTLSVIRQNAQSCRNVNQIFDKRIYAEGVKGRIIDIRVDTNGDRRSDFTSMDQQLEKYIIEAKRFHNDIIKLYRDIEKQRGDAIQVSPSFHQLVVEALAVVEEDKGKISKFYRKAPLDDYRVEFTIEYEIEPRIVNKFTTLDGGKGVVVHTVPDEHMPVDDQGNRAEFVMDPNSRINRMNLGGLNELYINATSRDVGKRIRSSFGIERGDRHALQKVQAIFQKEPEKFQWAWDYLSMYYNIIAPRQYSWTIDGTMTDEERVARLATICEDHVYLYVPPEHSPEYDKAIRKIENSPYKPFHSQVEYVGYSGKKVRTKSKVRIGSMYIIMLEKIGDDSSSVASGKFQHFGVLAKLTKEDKSSEPYRAQPIKGVGETEGRIFASYAGPVAIAELMDRNNNPRTHLEVVNKILSADKPTQIPVLIDRTKIPYGNTKPIQIVNHIAMCAGWKFEYEQKKPPLPYVPLKGKVNAT